MAKRFWMAAALSVAAISFPATFPPQASAHEAGLPVIPVIDAVIPATDGVKVTTGLSVVPYLQLDVTREVVVLGESGEPFLRLSPSGAELNERSPTAYLSADPLGRTPVSAKADPTAEPSWVRRSEEGSWRWFDPRLRAPEPGVPQADAKVVKRFAVPFTSAGQSAEIRGHLELLGAHGHLRTVIDRSPDGVEVKVQEGPVPALLFTNRTDGELVVIGRDAEPAFRIGPDGVFGNTRSAFFHVSSSRPVPADADPKAQAVWTKLSTAPAWPVLEVRARAPEGTPPDLGSKPKTVLRWSTPLLVSGRPDQVAGHVEWVPAEPSVPGGRRVGSPMAYRVGGLLLVAVVVVMFVAFFVLRRRPDGGPRPPAPGP